MSPPATLNPGSSYAQPLALLAACHERVTRSLDLLERLIQHLQGRPGGPDDAARDAAADVRRYFTLAAPLHHQDEELHLFPRLEVAGQAALAQRLRAEHRELEALWAPLDAALGRLDDIEALRRHALPFIALMRRHVALEDGELFPAALPLLDPQSQAAIGTEMAARRGLAL